MAKTDYLENEILKWCVGQDSIFGAGAHRWIGLFLAMPTDTGGGSEVNGTGYGRLDLGLSTGNKFGAPSGGTISNNAPIAWSGAGGPWGELVGWGVWDLQAGGNLLRYALLQSKKTIGAGDPASFAAGTLTLRED